MSAPALRTATPESVGIPSEALHSVLDFWEERGLAMHSLLVMRRDRLVLEAYWKPFGPQTLHRMFSQTKSLVSLAIGLLEEEGRLCLDDPICRYFPDKLPPAGPTPELAALTIREMLCMATPYRRTTYKDHPGPDWVGSFFTAPADHAPGRFFAYDTSATHVLCALVGRLSGEELLPYLRRKCLDEIGFSPKAYCLGDPMGIPQGGSGLLACPRDMLRLLRLLAAEGRWGGRQLLPAGYLRQALCRQIDTEANNAGGEWDFAQGYGYQFWRLSHNGWCLYGMGGQLSICLPDKDLLVVTTADTQGRQGGVQLILDGLWTCLWPRLAPDPLPENPPARAALRERVQALTLAPVAGIPWPGSAAGYDGTYRLHGPAGLREMTLRSGDAGGTLELCYSSGTVVLDFGAGSCRCGSFAETQIPCAVSAAWKDDRTLLVRVCLLGERTGSLLVQAVFAGNAVTLLLRCLEEYPDPRFEGTADGTRNRS